MLLEERLELPGRHPFDELRQRSAKVVLDRIEDLKLLCKKGRKS
jgi:hypothetical protein